MNNMRSLENSWKNKINWRIFFILLIASVTAAMLALPYTFSLSPVLSKIASPALVAAAFFQSIFIFSLAIFFGLLLAKRLGFRLPILEGLTGKESFSLSFKSVLWLSVALGVISGILILGFSLLFTDLSINFLQAEVSVAIWKGFLASFYGGIGEEVLFRLFVLTVFVWIFHKIKGSPDSQPSPAIVWAAIIISAVLFGLGHLGITADLTAITPLVIARAILLNGVPAIIFGWLYWKKGLESAIIAHFSTDIVIHVITPALASLFI